MSEIKPKDRVQYVGGGKEYIVVAIDGEYLWLKDDFGSHFTETSVRHLERVMEKWKVNTRYRNNLTGTEYYVVHVFSSGSAVAVWGTQSYGLLGAEYRECYDEIKK